MFKATTTPIAKQQPLR